MADPFVAEIRIFPFNFAPRGWAWCDGQLMPLSQNTALFSLLGTTYGGNGKSNFALPDLQGRAPMHPGQGPGLSLHDLGETGGSRDGDAARDRDPGPQPRPARRRSDAGDTHDPAGRSARRGRRRQRLSADRTAPLVSDGARGPRPRRRRPAAQQPAALPDLLLLHRPAGRLPAPRLTVTAAAAAVARSELRPVASPVASLRRLRLRHAGSDA